VKRFLLLYNGPPAPPDASHEGWPEWFDRIGEALVYLGSPTVNGLNGYTIVRAEVEALDLMRDDPLVVRGVLEVFEVPKR
jgi:hypothetical protein